MNVIFYPDKSDRPKTVLMISITFEGNRLKFSSGLSIENVNWDADNQSIRKRVPKASEINSFLRRLELRITETYNESLNIHKLQRKEFIANRVKEMLSHGSLHLNEDFKSLINHFEEFISKREKGQEFGSSTISAYRNACSHLKHYEKFSGKALSFDSFNEDFFDSFTSYLSNKYRMTKISVGTIVKSIKTFLNEAFKKGITKNADYKTSLKVWKGETTAIALTDEEMEKLELLDLSHDDNLREIRDLFIVQVNTGVRFSDLKSIRPEKINMKEKLITLNVRKTKENLVIPIFAKTEKILNQYPGNRLPIILKGRYNLGLKKICELAGIDEPIAKTIFIGKDRIDVVKKKFEMVSSHTARRTFITLLLKKDIHPRYIMAVSGHKDVKSFDKYIKLTQNEAFTKLRDVMDK